MSLTVEGTFTLIGSVPSATRNNLIKAVESVPQNIFFEEKGQPLKKEVPLDGHLADFLKSKRWDVKRNYTILNGSKFSIDLASEKRNTLIEIEKGQLPRLELDIIKMVSASEINPAWRFGALIVPATYITMKLATNTTPYEYLNNLKPLIAYMRTSLEGLVVIGYRDPRSR